MTTVVSEDLPGAVTTANSTKLSGAVLCELLMSIGDTAVSHCRRNRVECLMFRASPNTGFCPMTHH